MKQITHAHNVPAIAVQLFPQYQSLESSKKHKGGPRQHLGVQETTTRVLSFLGQRAASFVDWRHAHLPGINLQSSPGKQQFANAVFPRAGIWGLLLLMLFVGLSVVASVLYFINTDDSW